LGGALFILHQTGNLTLIDNKFITNTTPLREYCGGGAMTIIGLLTSYIISIRNIYQFNEAFRGILSVKSIK